MMQTAALLHPFLQGSFAQQDGLWAFPINLTFYDFLHFDETALALAGYTPADMPASFEEALDFLEQWIQRCQTDPVADVCVTNTLDGPASYTVYLTEQLIKQYTFQCAAQGLQADYTRPVFLEMLDRIAVIGPELSRADSGQGSFCLLTTCSFAKELIHMIPGRLTAQEPMLIPVSVTYLCVNGQSAHPEAAVRFVELYLDLMRNHDYDVAALTEADAEMLMAKALLFRDASDAVVSSDFAWKETYVRDTIAYYEGIAGSSSASETEKEQARVRLQQYDQAHWLENAIKGKYQLTSDELAQFQAMAGELRVCTVDYTVIASKRTRTLVKQFSSGVISAGELARGLNEQVR